MPNPPLPNIDDMKTLMGRSLCFNATSNLLEAKLRWKLTIGARCCKLGCALPVRGYSTIYSLPSSSNPHGYTTPTCSLYLLTTRARCVFVCYSFGEPAAVFQGRCRDRYRAQSLCSRIIAAIQQTTTRNTISRSLDYWHSAHRFGIDTSCSVFTLSSYI